MFMPLGGFFDPIWTDGWLYWWQIPLAILLVALLVFWKIYRSKQM